MKNKQRIKVLKKIANPIPMKIGMMGKLIPAYDIDKKTGIITFND